jgi:hypothetical protein
MVLTAALRQLQGDSGCWGKTDALQWLEKDVTADFKTAPEIMRISLSSSKPDDLVAVVDAVRNAYPRRSLTRKAANGETGSMRSSSTQIMIPSSARMQNTAG